MINVAKHDQIYHTLNSALSDSAVLGLACKWCALQKSAPPRSVYQLVDESAHSHAEHRKQALWKRLPCAVMRPACDTGSWQRAHVSSSQPPRLRARRTRSRRSRLDVPHGHCSGVRGESGHEASPGPFSSRVILRGRWGGGDGGRLRSGSNSVLM